MNTIMIVDDMPIFLEYLRGCIDWNSYGFEICCEAHDGKEALEKMAEFYPDVVLTDITMPYLNGLELSEKIVKDYPNTSVVLITGNNEFEYARKAVKIGVCDYIVKPFEKEELILSLLKLQDNINKAVESSKTEDDTEISDELRALIYAGVAEDEHGLSYDSRLFPGINSEGQYLVGLVSFNSLAVDSEGIIDEKTMERMMNWESLVVRMLGDKIDIEGQFRIFQDFENNIVILMKFEDRSKLENYKGYEFVDIIDIVKNQLDYDISIAIAEAENSGEIKRAYEKVHSYVLSKGKGQFSDLRSENDIVVFSSLDAIANLNKAIESLHKEDIEEAINGMWAHIKNSTDHDNNREDMGNVRIYGMNILSSAISILMTNIINSGFSVDKIYGEGFSPEAYFQGVNDSEELKEKVIYLFKKRIDFEKGKKTSKAHDIALSAKKYIEDNFMNSSLSVSDISEDLCVNQTYLRKMFKSEFDMTLSEYITQFRMQEAKKLITTTNEKLTVVAQSVGYSDVSYFSNVFKKYYGTSPRSMNKD